ncbi:erythrocyte membrane protein 1, PfEMP1, putative [Plasmodium reichenowi]|uniref:Erythrocyte membrane protein 1, PfEMP1, putative n=2 Tax=Plasmodium TaxID=5820 RepID=A0A2P9DCG7_PLARE|nr:erythrocyte membrane protein 1, PfEMP1, putative [Plasmodium reichenowi]
MAPASHPTPTYNSVKDLLEDIGESIQKEAKNAAQKRSNGGLEGDLKKATFNGEINKTIDACQLHHTKHTNVKKDLQQQNSCHGREEERFSDELSGQCTYNRIKDSENSDNSIGACAPYRRLHLCDYNLENINSEKIATHNLLLEVLLAAKHEGKSLVEKHKKYNETNNDSNICIALARSFADIGDIIRGKDLFLGNQQEKKKLEENLKKIFGKIHENLYKNIKSKYNDTDNNYYQLREDWWNENRDQVWRAITCHAEAGDDYFKKSSGGVYSFSNGQCGHKQAKVLTDLDYVPQFLRWFDEWADDFCRIRNHKLKNIKDACRDDKKELYCSHNGYDCTKIIGNEEFFSRESKCTNCLVRCRLYDIWLENQRKEFEKQKKKYEKEIQKYVSDHSISNSNINREYNKEFYEKFGKNNYKGVDDFLNLLNKGRYCKTENAEEKIDFTITGNKGIFSRSQYCQVCPNCRVDCSSGTCKEKNDDNNCRKINVYSPGTAETTQITVLYSGDEQGNITQKLKYFCKDENKENGKNYQSWNCYYKDSDDNKCKMTSSSQKEPKHRDVISFYNFFDLWVKNLLIDTINWKNELTNCLNNTNVTDCNNDCNTNCKCFENWVKTKENEWKKVKKVYKKENGNMHNYYKKLNDLFEGYFFHVMNELKKEAKWNNLKKKLEEISDSSKEKEGNEDSEGAIKVLFDHLKEIAERCVDNNSNESCDSSKKVTQNPCAKTHGSDKVVSVKHIAEMMQHEAHTQLEERGGESNLKGDASKGEYRQGGNAEEFKKDKLCEITKDHSNCTYNFSKEPCDNKGNGLQIGDKWEEAKSQSSTLGVYVRPRRQHMCTSNLEFLETDDRPYSNNNGKLINDSFLGDVLLSAKSEAKKIKELYKTEYDEKSVCRAIRYSFADIGDIIRGRDMWDKDKGSTDMEGHLQNVFKKIKENLPGIKEKYKDGELYTKLREDWWEANRHQVWRAMKCAIEKGNITKCNGIPIEDYIPQRLRWMTEWAEWYCKAQKKAYEKLEGACGSCMSKDGGKNCYKGTKECTNCTQACKAYKTKIQEWEPQWRKIKNKYENLYGQAQTIAGNAGRTLFDKGDPDYQQVVDFLKQLHKANGGKDGKRGTVSPTTANTNIPYATAAGYIHQEIGIVGCDIQTEFCEKENGVTPSTVGSKPKEKYAFRDKPNDYDDACECDKSTEKKVPKKKKEENDDVCQIVKALIKNNNGNSDVGGCNLKYKNGRNKYPVWNCDSEIDQTNIGACMPPRRQKICLYFVAHQKLTGKIKTENDLRDAFIKTAAAETFVLWQKYKTDKNSDTKLLTQLESGTIPEDFKRQMFYTFGDYRDIFFDTDISKKENYVLKAKHKIDEIFPTTAKENETKRRKWWTKHGPEIWQGMLCALEKAGGNANMKSDSKYQYNSVKFSDDRNGPDLETFAKRPQFLRWMTEWGEEFCKKQKEAYGKLVTGCTGCTVSKDGIVSTDDCKKKCAECKRACVKYKGFVQKWLPQWIQQSDKYKQLYTKATINGTSSDPIETKLLEYLKKLNDQNGTTYDTSGKYINQKGYIKDCNESKQKNFDKNSSGGSEKEYALRDHPHDHENKCNCKAVTLPASKKSEMLEKEKKEEVCNLVKKLLEDNNGNTKSHGCTGKQYNGWNCNLRSMNNEHQGICVPPRRQKLCISDLETCKDKTKDALKKSFINCAAMETHFAWLYYKGNNKKAQEVLKSGKIPDDFLRIMYYTFSDYKDILFGTDILKNNGNTKQVIKNINEFFKCTKDNEEEEVKIKPEDWWEQNKSDIWKGMLCALPHSENFKDKDDYKNPPEEFSSRPQFLRWFTEWSDEFCTERKKLEDKVAEDCSEAKEYEGCNKPNTKVNGNGSCAKSCKDYEEYITKKKTQYDSQKKKFDTEKNGSEPEYKDISTKDPPEYLKEKCLDHSCDCIEKVKTITDYWEKPHTTYENPDLQKKCQCPTPPCEIVDKILGTKDGTGYRDGCKTKYGTMTRSEWLCNGKGKEDGDVVCIPPRRRRLFVQKLQDLKGDETQDDLRKAFIECAAVETFFAWHEYKKEKEREDKEKNEENITYISSVEEDLQKDLESGKISEEFKKRMFYTLADYRDICIGKGEVIDTLSGSEMDKIKKNIESVFSNSGNKESSVPNSVKQTTPDKWWDKYGKDIWEGMLCALSYDAKTKEKNETVKNVLFKDHGKLKEEYTYERVTFKGGFDDGSIAIGPLRSTDPHNAHQTTNTTLSKFVKRPPYFRYLEEWADEFCRKQKYKLEKIKVDCRGVNEGHRYCDDDGFDCNEMCPNKNGGFDSFKCVSCAKSCRFYKKWINTKKTEFEKQEQKYKNKIDDAQKSSGNIYDEEFVEKLNSDYSSAELFLKNLKGPCCNEDTGNGNINFMNTQETFKHAQYCSPCSEIRFKCIEDNSTGVTKNACNKTTFKLNEDNKYKKEDSEQVGILVSDNKVQSFAGDLENDCKDAGIFEGINENKWSCAYVCDVDICGLESDNVKKVGEEQIILIRALFKRWIEHFLKDYNQINDKTSHCMKKGEGSTCISGCQNKCKCVEKWIKSKTAEWKIVRDRFFKQYKVADIDQVYEVKSFLQQGPFYNEVLKAIKPFEKLDDFEESNECNDTTNSNNPKGTKKDVVQCLLHKLKKEIDDCKKEHGNSKGNVCSAESSIHTKNNPQRDSDTHDTDTLPHGDVAPPFCNVPPNPCSNKTATNVVGVEVVAKTIQEKGREEMLGRSGKDGGESGESVLRANAAEGKYERGGTSDDFKHINKITKEHSNAIRNRSDNPCCWKDPKRLEIGEKWKKRDKENPLHTEAYMPPRREHMCTSNLEYLNTNSVGFTGANASDSLLGDVLLTAKMEGQDIKNKLTKNGDDSLICRVLKYSFADIGDIIKGTDMWELNYGQKITQGNLVKIFKQIKEQITDETIKGKYACDTEDNKYLQLRKDWWESNRDQVWKAMTCKTNGITCDSSVPYDDYIPQRLRWMTEWAEWYCKMQKEAYTTLQKGCDGCRSWKCGSEKECEQCKKKCKEYEDKIKPWKKKWETISTKYKILFEETKKDTNDSAITKQDQDVVAFLKKLKNQNTDNEIYSTAEGYVHQELPNMGCKQQTRFCENPSGSTSSDGKDKDKEYAFLPHPDKYKDKCECKMPLPPPSSPTPTCNKKACEIADEILKKSNGGSSPIDGCYPKNYGNNYAEWMCDETKFKNGQRGACMPPRRQKLCVNKLQTFTDHTSNGLRHAFIECAVKEMFFLWQKYGEDKKKEKATDGGRTSTKPDDELKNGTIPDDFKRQMFYTFADYRDIFFGKDMGKDVAPVNQKIIALFPQIGKYYHANIRQKWWEVYGPEIWEAMLCALEKAGGKEGALTTAYDYKNVTFGSDKTTLEDFAKRPQFLRWMTEWGEHFCKEQKKEYNKLVEKCKDCDVDDDDKTCNGKCDVCQNECKKYKTWLQKWKTQYTTQSKKYDEDKVKELYKNISHVTSSTQAYQYLHTQLKQFTCENDDCKCMEHASKQQKQSSHGSNDSMPESLDEKPKEVKDKCNCVRDECTGLSVTGSGFPDGSAFGGGVPDTKCAAFKGGLPEKFEPPQYDPTNDILKSTIPIGIALALGSIAFLYMKKKTHTPVDLLRVLDIPKGDYGMPTKRSPNRYIPYKSAQYKGKSYIYLEGDTDEEKYAFMSDTTDITSSESEYEELDINDIYVPGSPKYKTLIEVVLEPSKRDIPSDDTPPSNKLTDEEWNKMKHDFISQYVIREPMDVPNDFTSGNVPLNTQPKNLRDNMEEKPFIMSIHDRDLYTGDEISYNINMSTKNDIPISSKNDVYSGIDLINDSLSGNQPIDIYDEVLKRKENELFGTHHPKNTTTNRFAKLTNSDPIMNQLNLLHKWLDRHRGMCEQWNNKEDILNKLNEQWNKDNDGDNVENDNRSLNTNVSIEIDMDNPKPINQFSNMDTKVDTPTMDNMEDDIYYDVNDDDNQPSVDDIPMDHNKVDVDIPKKVHVEMKILNNISKSSLEQQFPISDVWNI